MMYGIIAKKLKLMNLGKAHPKDYLNFYCLGNRELQNGTSNLTNEPSEDNAMVLFIINLLQALESLCALLCVR